VPKISACCEQSFAGRSNAGGERTRYTLSAAGAQVRRKIKLNPRQGTALCVTRTVAALTAHGQDFTLAPQQWRWHGTNLNNPLE